MVRRLAPLALVATLALPTAQARHTDTTRVTDYSAYTLDQWEWRLGPFRNEVGVFDGVHIGIMPIYSLIRLSNFQVKWRAWQNAQWAVALRLGLIRFDSSEFREPEPGQDPLVATVFPVDVVASYRAARSTWSFGISGNPVDASGSLNLDEAEGSAAGAYSSASLFGSWEWRWTETLAIVTETRLKLTERFTGDVVTTTRFEDGSSLEVHGLANAEVEGAKAQATVSAYWSFNTFNLRLGGGYGNWVIPGTTIFVPEWAFGRTFVAELDMYWRF